MNRYCLSYALAVIFGDAHMPHPFQTGLIVHINAFTRKMDGGYLIEGGKKIGKSLSARQVSAVIAANWEIKISAILV